MLGGKSHDHESVSVLGMRLVSRCAVCAAHAKAKPGRSVCQLLKVRVSSLEPYLARLPISLSGLSFASLDGKGCRTIGRSTVRLDGFRFSVYFSDPGYLSSSVPCFLPKLEAVSVAGDNSFVAATAAAGPNPTSGRRAKPPVIPLE